MQNLNFILSFVCFLFALHLFRVLSRRQMAVRLLGACFLIMALQALFLGIRLTTGIAGLPAAVQPAVPLLFGACSYLLFVSAGDEGFRLKPYHLLHCIPAIFVTAEMLTGLFYIGVDLAVLLGILGYGIALAHLTKDGEKQFAQFGGERRAIFVWLMVFTVYSFLSFGSDLLIFFEVTSGVSIQQSLSLLLTIVFKLGLISALLYTALQKSSYFDWVYSTSSRGGVGIKRPVNFEHTTKIIEAFEALIANTKLYTDTEETLSLKAMADRLGVPPRQFSEAVNDTYQEGYSKFMNRKRVDYAKALIMSAPDITITDVMFDAGFRTKSSFNKEFKAIVGMSPSSYRNSLRR